MNKQELQSQLSELQKTIAQATEKANEIQEQLNRPDVITYKDVVSKVKPSWYISGLGGVHNASACAPLGLPREAIAKREELRFKLINISEFVNEGKHAEFYLYTGVNGDVLCGRLASKSNPTTIYFTSKETAGLALTILGRDNDATMPDDVAYKTGCELFKSMLIK
jgi:hypothetical protein